MLRHTFIHIPGVGQKTESGLWENGVLTWDDYEKRLTGQYGLFTTDEVPAIAALAASRVALAAGDTDFFADRLSTGDYYRVALTFPTETLFLDIETTGLSLHYDYITVVGWALNGTYGTYIRGDDPGDLLRVLASAKAIVTFNGSHFDVPFLLKTFPSARIPRCHIDLRFLVRRVGVEGGQKEVEERLGLKRPVSLEEVSGEAAPVLWHRYRWGDMPSLELLLAYNHADIDGMQAILDWAIRKLIVGSKGPTRIRELPRFRRPGRKLSRGYWQTESKPRSLPTYAGSTRPAKCLSDLRLPPSFKIVGIDLTGSAKRPSGWALLSTDGTSLTQRLGSDDVIVSETLRAGAHLVSIDSPLSLPVGRTRVEDSDPTRNSAGITRYCERVLRQRGINVYPCLLPSMQQLTARGMRLADRFRSLGVPVIESYPGAAQDILGIPRKRASLDLLARGLGAFGVHGNFQTGAVSHDELDAITSAIVGSFFWAGYFEGLGNPEEEYLIIPDVTRSTPIWGGRIVVGVSGFIAAGKTTAARHLADRGLVYGRYSQVLDSLARERGLTPSRETLQMLGREVNVTKGQHWLGNKLLSMLPPDRDLVIDGLRHPDDYAFLSETFGPAFLHLTLAASHLARSDRAAREGVPAPVYEAILAHPVEQNVESLAALAHETIHNDGSKELLFEQMDHSVAAFRAMINSTYLCR
jgi:uncharacterized protein YprB with RNaseH-like and TPR domain/predicted nuclease with RNAse H fold